MVIFLVILIFSGAITALITGYKTTSVVSVMLGIAILGINFLIKYIYANRKCPVCGARGGLYKMSSDAFYGHISDDTQEVIYGGDPTYCKYCEEIKNEIKKTRYADLRVQAEAEAEREKERNLEILSSKTCPHCGKYNINWDEIRKIYQSETINGALYQKFIYKRICKYCSHNDDRISDWI